MKEEEVILKKMEQIFQDLGYGLRYEKGNFRAGACLLKGAKVVIVNKHFTPEGKIQCLLDILKAIPKEELKLSQEQTELLVSLTVENEKKED